jgi:predicted nucleic acid-binding protein
VRSRRSSPVSNAGPLIHLAKAASLALLRALYDEIIIPSEVKIEVADRGSERGFADAIQIEEAINQGWLEVEDIRPSRRFSEAAKVTGLKTAEVAVIYYAHQNEVTALLDDEPARIFARTLGVKIRGSLGVLLDCQRKHLISKEEALERLDRLSGAIYLNPELYTLVRREMERQ